MAITIFPIINYDYSSPLGQYGQKRPTLNRIKQYHYWLNGFGSELAGMSVRKPAAIPTGSSDLSSLRWSVRSNGKSGYLFVNNYVRQHKLAVHADIQFAIEFDSGTVVMPSRPVTISSGSYFIWPLNLSLGGAKLVYSTAQLMTSLNVSKRHAIYIFIATKEVSVEFAFDSQTVRNVKASTGSVRTDKTGRTVARSIIPGLSPLCM